MRVLAILTVKNEGAQLIEWLAHHRAAGITDVLAASNDCEDGTDAMLDRLEAIGWLVHLRCPAPGARGPQWAALRAAGRHPLFAAADWVVTLDIDEFVNVHVGERSIGALLARLPDATAIPLTWRLFGNGGVVGLEDRPVTQTFLRAAPAVLHWPWRAAMFKTLWRNDGSYARPGVHRPRDPDPARLSTAVWRDGSGRRLPEAFAHTRVFTDPGLDSHALVQLNHYALGSMQGFVLKADRGRANREASAVDAGYWVERNFDAVEDRSILGLEPRSAPLHEALLADPVLGPLHAAAVAWRHDRFARLMQDEAMRDLYGRLLLAGPTRVLDEATARSIWAEGISTASLTKGSG